MIDAYLKHKAQREEFGIPPKPLIAAQVSDLIGLLREPGDYSPETLMDLISNRVPAGVDEASRLKADFLFGVACQSIISPVITPEKAIFLLGTMRGGYNTGHLINLLSHDTLGDAAAKALVNTILIFDAFDSIFKDYHSNINARRVVDGWAAAEWFTNLPEIPDAFTVTAFRVKGETNTDDLSPAGEAWSRPDIPHHALAMLESKVTNPIEKMNTLKKKGYPLAFVGDVVGTGSSRKSAVNSLLWHIGKDILHVPNKRFGGYVIGSKIAPIFFNSLEDAGALPLQCDVSEIDDGDVLSIRPFDGKIVNMQTGRTVSTFEIQTKELLDGVRAGGRIPLIIGRSLADRAAAATGKKKPRVFARRDSTPALRISGYTLAQKMVGLACGKSGILPGTYCEPHISTVGSQDTTGPMTRDELSELACLKFKADLVMQSFCHTAAYPRTIDVEMHESLHHFIKEREGVALYPGDGIIHCWLNRMVLPDTVGTGGDSHTRFPVGISFPAGSGMVAFAAAIGFMPLDMPESVLVKLSGTRPPGITTRDIVNGIARAAIDKGMLTVDKAGKKNVFSGRIMEIEGLPDLNVQQAYELTNASAERSASAATIALDERPVIDFLEGNAALLKSMIKSGYGDPDTITRRLEAIEDWLANPVLLRRDDSAQFAHILEVDLDDIKEPILACPNDPDDVRPLSEIAGTPVDEVFIGSCMTGIDHLRNAGKILAGNRGVPTRLWIAPATRMDVMMLKNEGYYAIFGRAGARIETPGCSLCMGNQARVADNATVVSTSTRNFPNRLGNNTNVYLASAELSAVSAILGRIPTVDEYFSFYSGGLGSKA